MKIAVIYKITNILNNNLNPELKLYKAILYNKLK